MPSLWLVAGCILGDMQLIVAWPGKHSDKIRYLLEDKQLIIGTGKSKIKICQKAQSSVFKGVGCCLYGVPFRPGIFVSIGISSGLQK